MESSMDREELLNHIRNCRKQVQASLDIFNELQDLKPEKPNITWPKKATDYYNYYVAFSLVGGILIWIYSGSFLFGDVFFLASLMIGPSIESRLINTEKREAELKQWEEKMSRTQQLYKEQEDQLYKEYEARKEKLSQCYLEKKKIDTEISIEYLNITTLNAFEFYVEQCSVDNIHDCVMLYLQQRLRDLRMKEEDRQLESQLVLQEEQLEVQRQQLQMEEIIAAGVLCNLLKK